jgi:hypothetical protein
MTIPTAAVAPVALAALPDLTVGLEPELDALAKLRAAGIAVAPLRVIPAQAEERFYKLNNLPAQLNRLFHQVDKGDPDEDDVEEVVPEAQKLLTSHYLLDEFIDLFYERLAALPAKLRVRRDAQWPGREAGRGRPALLSLKKLWAGEWTFDTVMERLEQTHSIALPARCVLIQAAGASEAGPELTAQAEDILGREVSLRLEPNVGVTHVSFA